MKRVNGKVLTSLFLTLLIVTSAFFCVSCGEKEKKTSSKVSSSEKEAAEKKAEVSPLEELQKKHEFYYYSSLPLAVNNSAAQTIGTGSDSNKETAIAGVYEEDGKRYVVLLKDAEETENINLSGNITLNLCGNTLTVKKGIKVIGENSVVNIDGTVEKSQITMDVGDTEAVSMITCGSTNTLNVTGGAYAAKLSGDGIKEIRTILCQDNSVLNLKDCEVIAKSGCEAELGALSIGGSAKATIQSCKLNADSTNGKAFTIYCKPSSVSEIKNCDVYAHSQHVSSKGIYISKGATAKIDDTKVFADSRSSHNEQLSSGIQNVGEATITNCNVYGNHSGMQTNVGAKTYVTGGRFESPSHGGIYFSHGSSGEAYIEGAEIAMCEYKGRYGSIEIGANGGLYIGSSTDSGNYMSIYFNNCEFINAGGPAFVLSSTYGGKSNTIYVSNSTIPYLSEKARIDSSTHKVYIGTGCNFTAENTRLPSAVIMTDEVYTRP